MKRLLILGSRGFLGGRLAALARSSCLLCDDQGVDITGDSLRAVFDRTRPEAVVLLAAISDIDRCEREKALAARVNLFGAAGVAVECARTGARLLFTSSAAVFDGEKDAYSEDDPPHPVSYYGETKARAEAAIRGLLPSAVLVRLSLALGFGRTEGTNSLLDKLSESFRAGREVSVPDEEYRNPIDAGAFCRAILDLIGSPEARGVYHIGAADSMSRYELARRLAVRMGYPAGLVVPLRESPPGRAPRGRNHFLLTGRLQEAIGFCPPTCEQVLERCLHDAAKSYS
ncbi:MAG: NAD(P)-dependent oxidoreductase [Acidobacteria bacterium]|nr:NAD(P)-dependent oxidoreductase [Acidobacteriota bacterium]